MRISEHSYQNIREWLKQRCGVELGDARQTMVTSRLSRRLAELSFSSVDEYVLHLSGLNRHDQEWTFLVDTLTTHETYFYRESAHFDFLTQIAFKDIHQRPVKILSAACSTGEESYTLAIEADQYFKDKKQWHIYGTDISESSVESAKRGLYPDRRIKLVPQTLLKQYFLKGHNEQEGNSLVKKDLKDRVTFFTANILENINYAPFDVIFCRNVLIYFDFETKRKVISNLSQMLTPGGYLMVSQTEQLRGLINEQWQISPSIMRKPSEDLA